MKHNLKIISAIFFIFTLFLSTALIVGQTDNSKRRLIIILDASYSMQDELEGEYKIELAKDTIRSILETYRGADMGVIVYGHRYPTNDKRSCDDIELVKDFSTNQLSVEEIMSIQGQGKTPIAGSIEFASKYFHPEKQNHIILLSDGIDTCNANPCETVIKLRKEYPTLRIDTVGFTLSKKDKDLLDCITDNTDGSFYSAYSLPELRDGIVGFFYGIDTETEFPIVENKKPNNIDEDIEEDMAFIMGGNFIMGKDVSSKTDERPAHEVFVQSFMMKETEVTNEEYAEFLNEIENIKSNWININKADIEFYNGEYRAVRGKEDLPVVYVSWYGARAYATHYGGRLPFEAEWEYAAYGGKYEKQYPWGNDEFADGKRMANYDYSRSDVGSGSSSTQSVGSYDPNEYGLYDIAGNVWEWCEDWYSDEYYEESEVFVPAGPIKGKYKVKRGGSWFNNETTIRVTNRGYSRPGQMMRDTGFRYVIPVTPESLVDDDSTNE